MSTEICVRVKSQSTSLGGKFGPLLRTRLPIRFETQLACAGRGSYGFLLACCEEGDFACVGGTHLDLCARGERFGLFEVIRALECGVVVVNPQKRFEGSVRLGGDYLQA